MLAPPFSPPPLLLRSILPQLLLGLYIVQKNLLKIFLLRYEYWLSIKWAPLFHEDLIQIHIILEEGSDPNSNFLEVHTYLDIAHDMNVVGAPVHLSVRHDVYSCIYIHWDILYKMFIYRVSWFMFCR